MVDFTMNDLLPKIKLDATNLQNTDQALELEWLVTNGLGGYASSTVLGVNTRKYHGLLVSALNPPVNRHVLLSKLDEEIQIENKTYKLGINEFRDTFYPKPQGLLHEFLLNPFPTFKYKAKEITLQKTIFMPTGKNTTIINYDVQNDAHSGATVKIFPLVNFRHFYQTTQKDQTSWNLKQKSFEQTTILQFTPLPYIMLLSTDKGKYHFHQNLWIEKLYYRVDAARGEECLDDCLSPGYFEFLINSKKREQFSIVAVASDNEKDAQNLLTELRKNDLYLREVRRREELLTVFQKRFLDVKMDDWLKWLILAVDSFVVTRASTDGKSVIAGYHWFEDWGRDSLISLTGLTLITGRFDDAREILSTFKQYCSQGIIPNRFPDREGGKPEYNTVDASLWYCNAVLQYVKYTGDMDFVKNELWSTLQSIIDNYEKGTINNIHMDSDGLISHGPQLTWMDATINNAPITPRNGKAVEIQALWHNALKTMQQLAKHFKQKYLEEKYAIMAEKARKSFVEKFWNPEKNCLFDVVNDNQKDPSLRPNQILAVSLDFPMLDEAKNEAVLETIMKNLWCPFGIKTLSVDDSRYVGKYAGNWTQRNQAYHNGTAWPWLLGSFTTAFLKVKKHESKWREYAMQTFLLPFFQKTIYQAGLGTVSEIFDGDEPHLPRGCIAQAWSVAEPLRAFLEDVLLKRPPYEKKLICN